MVLKHIPGSNGYFASNDGRIFDKNGNERSYYRNSDGYVTASIELSNREMVTFGVHRLVALSHIPINSNVDELIVNHIDYDKTNNDVENLEWVTTLENNIHSSLLRCDPKKPLVYLVDAMGNHSFVYSIDELKRILCSEWKQIWFCLKNNVPLKGYSIFPFTNRTRVPEALKYPNRGVGRTENRPIKMKSLKSNLVVSYKNLKEAALAHKTSSSHIFQCISKSGVVKLFNREFLIIDDSEQFPEITPERKQKLLGSTGRAVIAFNVAKGRYYIYESASSFIKQNQLSKKAVSVSLTKSVFRQIDGWYFTYLEGENTEKLKLHVGIPDHV